MRCQYCNCTESKVIDSRPTEEGSSIRRRRECIGCGRRFTTYEKIEMVPLMVIKRDGRREAFDPQKIKTGIIHASNQLPVSMQDIDSITTRIEQAAYASMESEIPSQKIGDMVMAELKALNDVAYVRFAAVYRKFTDLGTFMDELATMCGLTNVFADVEGWGAVSEEQVIARDPDYIITIAMYFGEGPTPVEEILSRPGWQTLKAVSGQTVFNADSDSISRPGPRLKDAALELAGFLK